MTNEQALAIARQVIGNLISGNSDALYALLDDTLKGLVSTDQLNSIWTSIMTSQGEYQGETNHEIQDVQGLKLAVLTLQFKASALNAHISINAQGCVGGFNFVPVPSSISFDLAADEQEITFQVGDDILYGTLLLPGNTQGKTPAVLMLSGSGPTDRDGNSTMLLGKIDSHKQFARVLANAGVASLRYDKIATGKTGMGSHQTAAELTFDLYVDAAIAGYKILASRPEINPAQMALLGHSEGGLIALVAADRMKDAPAAALMLFAPVSKPFLQTLREQVSDHYASAVAAQSMTQAKADDGLAELDQIIEQVVRDGTAPANISSQWAQIFSPNNLKFLQSVSRYDPMKLAEGLPQSTKVLILCGQKDQQISCADVKRVVDGFRRGGNKNVEFYELANVNHVFKEIEGVPNLQTDYTDPSKPFSHEAAARITDFVKQSFVS